VASIGIAAAGLDPFSLNFERQALYGEALKRFDQVLIVDPRQVVHRFVRGAPLPGLTVNDRDISSLDALIVRSTNEREAASGLLVRSLHLCGCLIVDPLDRFSLGKASKLWSTIERFERKTGTSTYVSFSATASRQLISELYEAEQRPLIAKPVTGRKGRGVVRLDTEAEALDFVNEHFAGERFTEDPLFLQEFVNFVKEYRVLIVDGEALGIVEKIRADDHVAANAAQGAAFVASTDHDVMHATAMNVSNDGVLGVDVGLDGDNNLHIIETNRAPLWQVFQQVTGVNVAERIIERCSKRLAEKCNIS
jgi:glutathione synthase/RimK-type ligase-like ATP-grasp enzyme